MEITLEFLNDFYGKISKKIEKSFEEYDDGSGWYDLDDCNLDNYLEEWDGGDIMLVWYGDRGGECLYWVEKNKVDFEDYDGEENYQTQRDT